MKLKLKKKLLKELETIKDFRIHQGKIEFKLSEVLFLIIFAMLKGKNTFVEQHDWIEANKKIKSY